MTMKIVADSSADTITLADVPFASVPLKIITREREFFDNESLNTQEMVGHLIAYKGASSTSCPAPHEYFRAFGDSERVFCVTISSALSGSYNAARIAKEEYEKLYPERKVFLIDSLSAGMELRLLVEKLSEYIKKGMSYDDICNAITAYQKKTGLLFVLESVKNLANNGRLSPLVARVVGLLGIRIVGKASEEGTVTPIEKCRGPKKALATLIKHLTAMGFVGGRLRIAHCENEAGALALRDAVLSLFPKTDAAIYPCRGLCSFYAEKGGLMIGFEHA